MASGFDGVFAIAAAWQAHPCSSCHPLRVRTPSPDLALLSRLHAPVKLPCCPFSWTGIPGRVLPYALARISIYQPNAANVPETRLTVHSKAEVWFNEPKPEELPVTCLAPLPPEVHTRAVVVGVTTRGRGLTPLPSSCRGRPAPSGRMPPHFAGPARPPPPSPAALLAAAACPQPSPCLVDVGVQVGFSCFRREPQDIRRPKGERVCDSNGRWCSKSEAEERERRRMLARGSPPPAPVGVLANLTAFLCGGAQP